MSTYIDLAGSGLSEQLARFSFQRVGSIDASGQPFPRFILDVVGQERGVVYLWVESSSVADTVVYVGKAGGTLRTRCKQHEGGFRSSVTGKAHAQRLVAGIGDGKRYSIWVRHADTVDLLGEREISLVDTEELAFIQKFQPAWNKISLK